MVGIEIPLHPNLYSTRQRKTSLPHIARGPCSLIELMDNSGSENESLTEMALSKEIGGQNHQNTVEWLRKPDIDPWITVYRRDDQEGQRCQTFSALVPESEASSALERDSWDITGASGQPGFSRADKGDEFTYQRFGGIEPFETLVVLQDFHGVKDTKPKIAEEFRLFHNLWEDPKDGSLYEILDDGNLEKVAEVADDLVRIRTSYLKRFLAAKQCALIQFVDNVIFSESSMDKSVKKDHASSEEIGISHRVTISEGDTTDRIFSRLLGKKITHAPAIEDCGIWPYEQKREERYPDFIIDEDGAGDKVLFTCDPNKLSDYFGANRGAPHYLTPVFFRREVLKKYYDDDKFQVDDANLRCAGLWSLPIDNDLKDEVSVFLGDLGQRLPEGERDYWKSFNISPTGSISDTNYRRSFLAEFADAVAPDLIFKSEYEQLKRDWVERHQWAIYREVTEGDAHLITSLRIPLNETQSEFDSQVTILAKLLVDLLNEAGLTQACGSKVANEKGISKLERYMTQFGYRHTDRDIGLLREIQNLRSAGSAHAKGSKYESAAKKRSQETNQEFISALIQRSILFIRDMNDPNNWRL